MKKIISALLLAAVGLASFPSCTENDFNEKYADPSKTTTVGVPQVFTAVLFKARSYMDPCYYRYYTQSTTSGIFSGVIATDNGKGRWMGAGEGYYNTRWMSFYDVLTQHRLLENTYNDLPESQKSANKIFVLLSRTIVQHQLHEMMSCFGDVPYNGACQMYKVGYDKAKEAAVYDDDEALYRTILSDLKETAQYLQSEDIPQVATGSLSRQDYTMAAGSVNMWARFTNSLRLRIALHLASQGSLAAEAQAVIKEIVEYQYALIEDNSQNMGVENSAANDDVNFAKGLSQALFTSSGSYAQVSQTFLDAMNLGENGVRTADSDPRLQAMLDPNPYGQYLSYDVKKSSDEITQEASKKSQELVEAGFKTSNYYVRIDSVAIAGMQTYEGNTNLKSQWINAAEVSLSLAEAYYMGYGVAKDEAKAKEYFVKGVEQSCEYYWNIKVTSSYFKAGSDSYKCQRDLELPRDGDFTKYANALWENSDNLHKTIATQLWLNFSFMNELEAWNVVRRTGYPVFDAAKDNISAQYANPPYRLPYPSSEIDNNTDNCNAAKAKNYGSDQTGYYTNLFWAKDNYWHAIN